MVNKFISSVILATSLAFLALSNSQPDNLLFLFVSPNKMIAVSRVLLAVGMVLLSFRGLLTSIQSRSVIKFLGLGLIAFGGLAMVQTSLGSAMYDYVKLLDVMIIVEAGIIFTSCALTLSTPALADKSKAPKTNLSLRQKTA